MRKFLKFCHESIKLCPGNCAELASTVIYSYIIIFPVQDVIVMEQLQREEKQIRKQLEEAYKQKDREKVVEAAKQLSLLAMRVIQR